MNEHTTLVANDEVLACAGADDEDPFAKWEAELARRRREHRDYYRHVPHQLRAIAQWVGWYLGERDGKLTKIPLNARTIAQHASATNPATWGTFDQAIEARCHNGVNGIGFVFTPETGIFGFDADGVRDPDTGEIEPETRQILDALNTYTEISPSGRGVHAIGFGTLPAHGAKHGKWEIYNKGRFFTITGQRLDDYPADVMPVDDAISHELYARVDQSKQPAAPRAAPTGTPPAALIDLGDEQIIALARGAKNGAKFRALFDQGDVSSYGDDQSAADLALAGILCFYTQDLAQVMRIMRGSALMRDKYERADYLDRTIQRALSGGGETYTPRRRARVGSCLGQVSEGDTRGTLSGSSEGLRVLKGGKSANVDQAKDAKKSRAKKEEEEEQDADLMDAAQLFKNTYAPIYAYDAGRRSWRVFKGTHHELIDDGTGSMLAIHSTTILRKLGMNLTRMGQIKDVLTLSASLCVQPFNPPLNLINFQNGVLDTTTGRLTDHAPEYGFTYCLPFAYREGEYPAIHAFLAETMTMHPGIDERAVFGVGMQRQEPRIVPDADAIKAYMLHIGLALLRDWTYHKAILLIGPPRSGKSTLLKLANAATGQDPEAMAGAALFDRESEGLRSRALWNERLMVALEELPVEALRNEETFKAMTAHSGVSMRRMYQPEIPDNQWKPKLIMAANEHPRYGDRSGALTRRVVPIACPNGRPDDDLDPSLFRLKLLPELPGFVAACLNVAQAALATPGGSYPMSQAMRNLLSEIESGGDALKAWVRDHCVLDPNEETVIDTLWTFYKDQLIKDGNTPMAKERFSAALQQRYPQLRVTQPRQPSGARPRCLQGVRLRGVAGGVDEVDTVVF